MENFNSILPTWIQELKRFLRLKSQFYLYGNIYDCYYFPINIKDAKSEEELSFVKFNNLKDLIERYLLIENYELLCYFDIIDGIKITSVDNSVNINNLKEALNIANPKIEDYIRNAIAKKVDDVFSLFREIMNNKVKLTAGIINFASHFTSNPNFLEEHVRPLFLKILKSAQESFVFPQRDGLRNIMIFICDKINDLPAWLLVDNPLTKEIEIQKPCYEERKRFIKKRSNLFYSENQEINLKNIEKIFPDLTEGFYNRELENLLVISNQEKIHVNDIRDIIELYKYGVKDNPWEKLEFEIIDQAADELRKRVLGQEKAISKVVEIIRRNKLGLDAIDRTKPSNKPRGVLFFAGPTGTGKTELAKSLAELIFSDEDAMIRFDMTEYNDSNSDVKLIGAPPGYVGYESGGQLTTAVKKKPFSIILFDEIEKAHPKVFDKFLQILDDGRLTDGKGETVYFSQSMIIFTSNLGMYKITGDNIKVPNISYNDDYATIEEKIKKEIKTFFTSILNRPEIFNRFGDNFIVFDYIRYDIALKIIEKNLSVIKENLLKTRNISLTISDNFIKEFFEYFVKDNIEMGGRGIVNRIETYIKNGLTNYIYESRKIENCEINMYIENKKVCFK